MRTLLNCILFVQLFIGCTQSDISLLNEDNESDYWIIPKKEVSNNDFSNKDHIVSIDKPKFISVDEVKNLNETDLVFAIKENNIVKVYPIQIMSGHEIINDSIDSLYFAVSYCPQTKSGICINRKIRNKVTEFGVSGMLYKENLMPYDRNTESIWSQMLGKCVKGQLVTEEFETIMMILTNWAMIKEAYPDALVLTDDSFKRSKSDNVSYGGMYLGIIQRFDIELYSYESLKNQWAIIEGREIVIGNNLYSYISVFKASAGVTYKAVSDSLPVVLSDSNGNRIDVFGYVVAGPDKGLRLETVSFYSALYWAWEDFYEIGNIWEF